ncbi:MAG: flagellin, partial [Roseicyclus sp.]
VNAAQFNGLNLVKGTEGVDILGSLDRSADGSVSASNIAVARQDLTTSSGTYASNTNLAANITASNGTIDSAGRQQDLALVYDAATDYELTLTIDGETTTLNVDGGNAAITDDDTLASAFAGLINGLGFDGVAADTDGGTLEILNTQSFQSITTVTDAVGGTTGDFDTGGTLAMRAESVTLSTAAAVNAGDGYEINVGGSAFRYVAGEGETMEDVARGLKAAVDAGEVTGVTTQVSQDATTGAWSVNVDYEAASGTITLTGSGSDGGEASGGLFGLNQIDVTSNEGASAALDNIETLIQNSIDASANFGSAQGRIETQSGFVSKLMDSLKSGIGALVDADMEEASARLQALQVQQQLATQSLSIANQAPQNILALFR